MVLISANVGKVFDGWTSAGPPPPPSCGANNSLGMTYFIVGLLWNLILFFTRVTDTFQPTDIWNYYYFVVWGHHGPVVTGSFVLGLAACMFMNLFVLRCRLPGPQPLQEYYGYEGLTCTCICVTNISILAALLRWCR